MRVVLDTNILVSAILSPAGYPASIYAAWQDRRFRLLTCCEQLDELRATLRKPSIIKRLHSHKAGKLVNQIRALAEVIPSLPKVRRSPDSEDDYLLALCEASDADYLVTGDKSGLLSLRRHKSTRIISASQFANNLGV